MNDNSAVAALAALGFQTRLKAVQLLAAAGKEGLAAGEIARRLEVQQNTLSQHLRALAQADVVEVERRGRLIIYRANAGVITELVDFLVSTCLSSEHEGGHTWTRNGS